MSKIAITIPHIINDGELITFRAPCASSGATALQITAVTAMTDGAQTTATSSYTMKDAAASGLSGRPGVFEEGAYVSALLDTTHKIAYILNPATPAAFYYENVNYGLTIRLRIVGSAANIRVFGTPTGNALTISNSSVNIATFSALAGRLYTTYHKRVICGPNRIVRFVISKEGVVSIESSRTISDYTAADLVANESIAIDETFLLI